MFYLKVIFGVFFFQVASPNFDQIVGRIPGWSTHGSNTSNGVKMYQIQISFPARYTRSANSSKISSLPTTVVRSVTNQVPSRACMRPIRRNMSFAATISGDPRLLPQRRNWIRFESRNRLNLGIGDMMARIRGLLLRRVVSPVKSLCQSPKKFNLAMSLGSLPQPFGFGRVTSVIMCKILPSNVVIQAI